MKYSHIHANRPPPPLHPPPSHALPPPSSLIPLKNQNNIEIIKNDVGIYGDTNSFSTTRLDQLQATSIHHTCTIHPADEISIHKASVAPPTDIAIQDGAIKSIHINEINQSDVEN